MGYWKESRRLQIELAQKNAETQVGSWTCIAQYIWHGMQKGYSNMGAAACGWTCCAWKGCGGHADTGRLKWMHLQAMRNELAQLRMELSLERQARLEQEAQVMVSQWLHLWLGTSHGKGMCVTSSGGKRFDGGWNSLGNGRVSDRSRGKGMHDEAGGESGGCSRVMVHTHTPWRSTPWVIATMEQPARVSWSMMVQTTWGRSR
jgi:hypothetical protein